MFHAMLENPAPADTAGKWFPARHAKAQTSVRVSSWRGSTISYAFTIHASAIWRYPCTFAAVKVTGLWEREHNGTGEGYMPVKISSNNADRELQVSAAYIGKGDVPPAIMEKAAFGRIIVRGMAQTESLSACRVANVNTACRTLPFGQSVSQYVMGQ